MYMHARACLCVCLCVFVFVSLFKAYESMKGCNRLFLPNDVTASTVRPCALCVCVFLPLPPTLSENLISLSTAAASSLTSSKIAAGRTRMQIKTRFGINLPPATATFVPVCVCVSVPALVFVCPPGEHCVLSK